VGLGRWCAALREAIAAARWARGQVVPSGLIMWLASGDDDKASARATGPLYTTSTPQVGCLAAGSQSLGVPDTLPFPRIYNTKDHLQIKCQEQNRVLCKSIILFYIVKNINTQCYKFITPISFTRKPGPSHSAGVNCRRYASHLWDTKIR
jgi:hypothetical protein